MTLVSFIFNFYQDIYQINFFPISKSIDNDMAKFVVWYLQILHANSQINLINIFRFLQTFPVEIHNSDKLLVKLKAPCDYNCLTTI